VSPGRPPRPGQVPPRRPRARPLPHTAEHQPGRAVGSAAVERIEFTGARETMLATLYGRADDARAARPILGDEAAAAAVERIAYDFRKPRMSAMSAAGVAMRALLLDTWTREFLADHPEATVLHLACGLDTRVYRVDPGPGVHWYDVDYPDV